MITLKEALEKSRDFLEQKGLKEPRRAAEEVLAHCLSLARIELYLRFDQPIEEKELVRIRENLSRRAKREPLQYIEGKIDFYKSSFKLAPQVLIPRQETEQMVEKIAESLQHEPLKGKVLWDVCCGSGCIGLSLKKEFPDLRVILSDLSPGALSLAQENAARLDLEVECYQGDLLNAFEEPVDYLVCNPPYISEKEFDLLEPEVRLYEPKMALVSGPHGLEIYQRLAKELKHHLKGAKKVWMEFGSTQKEDLKNLFEKEGHYKLIFERDYAGLDRFFSLELE